MYGYYIINYGRIFGVLLKEFFGRVERYTEEKCGVFQLLYILDTLY